MNETAQTLSDLPEDRQLFAEIIIEFIENEYRESGDDRVLLEDISFKIVDNGKGDFIGIGNFDRNTGIPRLQEIAEIQGDPDENLLITAQRMLDLFEQIGFICVYLSPEKHGVPTNIYRLSKEGLIYNELERTP